MGILTSVSVKVKVAFVALFGTGAFFILAMSLQSSNVGFSPLVYPSSSQRPIAKMLSNEMVPGNPIYTLMMARDRVVLWLTFDPIEDAWLRVDYGNRRLDSASTLLQNDEDWMAINTFAKAEIYMGKATELLQKHDPSQLPKLRSALLQHRSALQASKTYLGDADRARIDQLINYNASLISTISQQ